MYMDIDRNGQHFLHTYPEIFDNLNNYAVIRNVDDRFCKYTVFNRTNNSYVILEVENDLTAELMIQKGVPVYDDVSQAKNPDYEPFSLKWDDQKKEWIKVSHKDL
jgi:hypothetical protein